LLALAQVVLIRKSVFPASQSNALYLEAEALQRQDFTPDEAMAYFGVLVDEIRDFQAA